VGMIPGIISAMVDGVKFMHKIFRIERGPRVNQDRILVPRYGSYQRIQAGAPTSLSNRVETTVVLARLWASLSRSNQKQVLIVLGLQQNSSTRSQTQERQDERPERAKALP
jgi:hypothetical protein